MSLAPVQQRGRASGSQPKQCNRSRPRTQKQNGWRQCDRQYMRYGCQQGVQLARLRVRRIQPSRRVDPWPKYSVLYMLLPTASFDRRSLQNLESITSHAYGQIIAESVNSIWEYGGQESPAGEAEEKEVKVCGAQIRLTASRAPETRFFTSHVPPLLGRMNRLMWRPCGQQLREQFERKRGAVEDPTSA